MRVSIQNRNCLFYDCHYTVNGRVSAIIYKKYVWAVVIVSYLPNPSTVMRINFSSIENMTKHGHY